jgi:hypothetical protein
MTTSTTTSTAVPIVPEPAVAEALPTAAPEPEVVPLPDILRQVGRDSLRDPQLYLDETRVPYGGE